MPLATHLLHFRDHTRVFLTMSLALVSVASFLASLLSLAS